MSTMYYTLPEKRQIGQVHNLGKDKGYHFTWCMYPLEFAESVPGPLLSHRDCYCDEFGKTMDFFEFQDIVHGAASQSFDERIV